jgi:signal transduction histidine kinase
MNDFNMLRVLEDEHEKTAASGVEGIGQNALSSVADTARQIRLQEQEVGMAKEALKQAETEMRRLTDDVMPTLFSELGLQSFKMEDGSELMVRETYSATPLVANRPQVHQWLRVRERTRRSWRRLSYGAFWRMGRTTSHHFKTQRS